MRGMTLADQESGLTRIKVYFRSSLTRLLNNGQTERYFRFSDTPIDPTIDQKIPAIMGVFVPSRTIGSLASRLLFRWNIKSIEGASDENFTRNHV